MEICRHVHGTALPERTDLENGVYLKTTEKINFLINDLDESNDCLLFVPLLVSEEVRDSLKQHLISESIYCPVHWPLPRQSSLQKCNTTIYNQELSLINDQRYNLLDMQRLVTTIGEFKTTL